MNQNLWFAMRSGRRKLLSGVLAFVIILTAFPIGALAALVGIGNSLFICGCGSTYINATFRVWHLRRGWPRLDG